MKNGYTIYSLETASKDAQVILQQVRENLKFVPNALGAQAESPQVLQAYLQLGELVQQTSFSDVERHLLYLIIAREYGSTYCMAAHTMFAAMDNIPDALVQQLREGKMLDDPNDRIYSAGIYLGADTLLGALYIGYGRSDLNQSAWYLVIGPRF